ncbi:unnamed protein product [Nyctereutes procyonoides]|uniref:(raccoon dog) hypothetical protein n=1 Tax=Nyctereutes procyonoides TaxID=34880 RepID=A0A811ZUP9_NYCPR|nr:unnamed protein product [Nyctereutes procyonoides]
MRDTQREAETQAEREAEREKQAPCREPNTFPGKNPGSLPLHLQRKIFSNNDALVRRNRGPVRTAARPRKRGTARKGAIPSSITQHTFVGNQVLNHS